MKSTYGLGLICLGLSLSACQKTNFKSTEVGLSSLGSNQNIDPVIDADETSDPSDSDTASGSNSGTTTSDSGTSGSSTSGSSTSSSGGTTSGGTATNNTGSTGTSGSTSGSSSGSTSGGTTANGSTPVLETNSAETDAALQATRYIYRLVNSRSMHLYSVFQYEAAEINYYLEGIAFPLYVNPTASRIMLYRCYHVPSGSHFFSWDRGCEGTNFEGEMGYAERSYKPGLRPLRRMVLGRSGFMDHLITSTDAEALNAEITGYTPEGVLGWVP